MQNRNNLKREEFDDEFILLKQSVIKAMELKKIIDEEEENIARKELELKKRKEIKEKLEMLPPSNEEIFEELNQKKKTKHKKRRKNKKQPSNMNTTQKGENPRQTSSGSDESKPTNQEESIDQPLKISRKPLTIGTKSSEAKIFINNTLPSSTALIAYKPPLYTLRINYPLFNVNYLNSINKMGDNNNFVNMIYFLVLKIQDMQNEMEKEKKKVEEMRNEMEKEKKKVEERLNSIETKLKEKDMNYFEKMLLQKFLTYLANKHQKTSIFDLSSLNEIKSDPILIKVIEKYYSIEVMDVQFDIIPILDKYKEIFKKYGFSPFKFK
ncbi:MAG: hypothetical protein SOY33_06635 [Candidatus Onthovivens sp.]|nr:hypothetical protein [Bacilli bacterium]